MLPWERWNDKQCKNNERELLDHDWDTQPDRIEINREQMSFRFFFWEFDLIFFWGGECDQARDCLLSALQLPTEWRAPEAPPCAHYQRPVPGHRDLWSGAEWLVTEVTSPGFRALCPGLDRCSVSTLLHPQALVTQDTRHCLLVVTGQ